MAKVKITGHQSGSGVFTITAPNSNTDRTITLPDASVTLGTDATKLPLAGGTMTGHTLHGDNINNNFGADNDLMIYHNGSNSYINNTTGSLYIRDSAGDIYIQAKNNENSIVANNDGSVELYHDNAKKLETTATGIAVTGKITGAVGSVLQTGTGTKTGEYDMNSGTLTDIPSMNVTLSPSAQGSKFLVMVAIAGVGRHGSCNGVKFNLQRTISGVGTVHRLIVGSSTHEGSTVNVFGFSVASMLLDVPNTTNNITWTVQNATANSTGYARINSNHGTNTVFSSITVQEIGA